MHGKLLARDGGMSAAGVPDFRNLTKEESEELLERGRFGRLAFSHRDRVDIAPIHYVYDAPWIFGRTGVGAKLVPLAHNRWCAFEVDEVRDLFDWQSVVVKGPFEALNSELGTADRYERAIAALRRLIPETLTDNDPTPERNVVFGIHVSEIEGRAASTKGAATSGGSG